VRCRAKPLADIPRERWALLAHARVRELRPINHQATFVHR
jgi:hypothetical protein